MSIHLKQQLYSYCNNELNQRITALKGVMDDIKTSLLSETKSTAGDKHETGRAMLQLEREKTGKQLAAVQQEQALLAKINPDASGEQIHLGSLIATSNGYYYLAIGIGAAIIDNNTYFIMGPQSPIGKLLLGKKAGDSILFNGKTIQITKVF